MSPDIKTPVPAYRPGYEIAAEHILTFITHSQLKVGDRLPTEQQLSEQLGVGHTVLREAVKMLIARGYIRARRGSGIYITDLPQNNPPALIDTTQYLDPEEVSSWFECRLTLELQTARLAAERITPREMQKLKEAVILNRDGAEALDYALFDAGDNAFHQGIANASHNPFLATLITTTTRLHLWSIELTVTKSTPTLLASTEQHEAILYAIQSGQPDLAAQAMKLHIDSVAQNYNQEIRRRLITTTRR